MNQVSKLLLFILVKHISFILDRSKKKGGQLPPVPPPGYATEPSAYALGLINLADIEEAWGISETL